MKRREHYSRAPKKCEPNSLVRLFKPGSFLWDVLYGLQSRIPLCCVLAYSVFCWRYGVWSYPSMMLGCHDQPQGHDQWVHCRYHRWRLHLPEEMLYDA